MSKGLYFSLGLITGLGIGAVVLVAVRNRDRIKHEEEIESVKNAYRKAFSVTTDEEIKHTIGPKKAEELREANKRIDYNKYAKLVRDVDISDITKVVTGNQYEDMPVEGPSEDEIEEEKDHPPEGGPQEPFIITPEEFAAEPEYAKEDLDYYIVSDTLVDEHDVEVDDIDRLIGYDNLRHMGEYEPGCLWVRNPNIMTDYQIVGIHGAWNG